MHVDSKPWHKYPLVWMLIAIPLSAVLVGVVIIYLAVTTDDGLVADDYYKQGLTINRELAKQSAAKELQLSATVKIDMHTGFIQTVFNQGNLESLPTKIHFALKHATKQSNDKLIILHKGIGNNYVGSIAKGIPQGVWHINLSSTENSRIQWRLAKRVKLENVTTVLVQPN